jgi:hypothetical protein
VVASGRTSRALCEQTNPAHRVRVEHDNHTLLVHISDEDGHGWTTVAIDRVSRVWSVAQRDSQVEAATHAFDALYGREADISSELAVPGAGGTLRR